MKCPNCKKKTPRNKEMCVECGYPVKPIPVPPGGKIRFGKYDWHVLDKRGGRSLIITEKVIERRPYHGSESEITWETCDMRKYLNGEFYNSFSEADRVRIIEVTNENPDNPWYGTRGGNPTDDKIFFLSIDEVLKYFGDSGQIKTRYMYPNCDWCKDEFLPWLDDKYNLNRRAVDNDSIVWHWRLRSPGANGRRVATVMGFCKDGFDQGGIDISGCSDLVDGHFQFDGPGALLSSCSNIVDGSFVSDDSAVLPSNCSSDYRNINGVRPALWLKTEG
ncbi:MAG: DUF6273 domain-containing protein [Oscillospiraceae bacterium]|nr:DUF6273 domain-containing protein [Oscillospiraceae bacterium]